MRNIRNSEQGFIIFSIPIVIIIVLVIIFSSGGDDSTKQATESNIKETISQSNAESYCQDTALLGKYIDLDTTSIVSTSNYNVQYQDDGATFNKDGYPIKNLQWTGKNNNTDKDMRFSCWVSGPVAQTTLHWLSVNNEDLQGSSDFESYDKDGNKLN
jgi:hypothetical protein